MGQTYQVEFTNLHTGIGLNNHGHVAGITSGIPGTFGNAGIYRRGIGVTNLGVLGGGNESSAWDINDQGMVVGESYTSTGRSMFSWTEAGGIQDLGSPVGYQQGRGSAINNFGQVSGTATQGGGPNPAQAYMWSQSTGFVTIMEPATTHEMWEATGINDSGVVIGTGSTFVVTDPNRPYGGFYWSESQGHQRIRVGDRLAHRPNDINNANQIVGTDQLDAGYRAWIWDQSSGFVDIPLLPGNQDLLGWGINENSAVVGGYRNFNGTSGAFIWKESTGTIDLKEITDLPDGFSLVYARDINDSGQILAEGRFSSNPFASVAVLLNPVPEPASCLVIAVGLVATTIRMKVRR